MQEQQTSEQQNTLTDTTNRASSDQDEATIKKFMRGSHLAAAGTFFVWGVLIAYAPTYLGINVQWVIVVFQVVSFLSYIRSLIDLGISYRDLFKNPLFLRVTTIVFYFSGAVSFHYIYFHIVFAPPDIKFLMRCMVILSLILGVGYLFECLAYFFCECEMERKAIMETFSAKNVLTLILSIIATMTIIIQFIQLISPAIPNVHFTFFSGF